MQWRKNGKRLRDADGKIIRCDACPCCKVFFYNGYYGQLGYYGLYGNRATYGTADPQAAFPACSLYISTSAAANYTVAATDPPSTTEGFGPYDVVFLTLPYDLTIYGGSIWGISALTAWFGVGRKRLVLSGEWQFPWIPQNNIINAIATALGSGMQISDVTLNTDVTNGYVDTVAHPLTTGNGISEVFFSGCATVTGGTPLTAPTSVGPASTGALPMAWESLSVTGGKSELVVIGDSNQFGDFQGTASAGDEYDNADFFRGFCSVPVAL